MPKPHDVVGIWTHRPNWFLYQSQRETALRFTLNGSFCDNHSMNSKLTPVLNIDPRLLCCGIWTKKQDFPRRWRDLFSREIKGMENEGLTQRDSLLYINEILKMQKFVQDDPTVPFHSIRQSRVTGPSKMPKCHSCHSDFHGVPNSFGNHVTNIANFSLPAALKLPKISQNLGMSRQLWEVAETKILGLPLDALGVYLPWLADNFPASSGKITFSQYFRIFSTSIG